MTDDSEREVIHQQDGSAFSFRLPILMHERNLQARESSFANAKWAHPLALETRVVLGVIFQWIWC